MEANISEPRKDKNAPWPPVKMTPSEVLGVCFIWSMVVFVCLLGLINKILIDPKECFVTEGILLYGWPQNILSVSDIDTTSFNSFQKCAFFLDRSLFSLALAVWAVFGAFWIGRRKRIPWSLGDFFKIFIPFCGVIFLSFERFSYCDKCLLSYRDNLFFVILKSFLVESLFYMLLWVILCLIFSTIMGFARQVNTRR